MVYGMTIRSNASLEAIAEAATKQEAKLNARYAEASRQYNICDLSRKNEAQAAVNRTWEHYRDVRDLAQHLRRLAGIDES